MGSQCCNFSKQDIVITYNNINTDKKSTTQLINFDVQGKAASKHQSGIISHEIAEEVEEKENLLFLNDQKSQQKTDIQISIVQDLRKNDAIANLNVLPSSSSIEDLSSKLISRIKHISLYKAKSKCSNNPTNGTKQTNTNSKLVVSHLSFNNSSLNTFCPENRSFKQQHAKRETAQRQMTSLSQNELLRKVRISSWTSIIDYLGCLELRSAGISCRYLNKLAKSPIILRKFFEFPKRDPVVGSESVARETTSISCSLMDKLANLNKCTGEKSGMNQIDVICEEEYYKTEISRNTPETKLNQELVISVTRSVQTKFSISDTANSKNLLSLTKKIQDLMVADERFSGSVSDISCGVSQLFSNSNRLIAPEIKQPQINLASKSNLVYINTPISMLSPSNLNQQSLKLSLNRSSLANLKDGSTNDKITACFE